MLTGPHAKYFTCDFLSPNHPAKWLLLSSSFVNGEETEAQRS